MVVYQGGKSRIGKRIAKVISHIESALYQEKLPYFEPFVGMAGVLRHFACDSDRETYACDANEDIILMWQALQKDWIPPVSCDKEEYERLKQSKIHSPERGFIGSVASWGGIFFHACRLHLEKNGRNFIREGHDGILEINKQVVNTVFMDACCYSEFEPEGYTIYADPPYQGNKLGTSRCLFQTFDHDKFWKIMRLWSKKNLVVISETSAPSDFIKIWSTESSVMSGRKAKRYPDNLYVFSDTYELLTKYPSIRKHIENI